MTPTSPLRDERAEPASDATLQQQKNLKKNSYYQSITVEYHEDDEDEPVTFNNSPVDKRKNRAVALFTGFVCLACAAAVLSSSPRDSRLKMASSIGSSSLVADENSFPSMKIIGGDDVEPGEYPWFATAMNDGRFMIGILWAGCGGMLVSPEYVLTAAHCVDLRDPRISKFPDAYAIGNLCMSNGNNIRNCNQFQETIAVEDSAFTLHPDYQVRGSLLNDFALVRLNRRSTVTPVQMDVDNDANYDDLWTLGFGDIDISEDGQRFPDNLQDVKVSYVDLATCSRLYRSNPETAFWPITENMICASEPNKDSCQGDSGGPLYDKERKRLVGVVSFGYGCALPGLPGVYAKVSSQISWIKSTICGAHSDPKPDFCPTDTNVVDSIGLNPTDPLGFCEGDCDNDSDCQDDLVCFLRGREGGRSNVASIPGCTGTGISSWDYCVKP